MLSVIINIFIIFIFITLYLLIKKSETNLLKTNKYLGMISHTINSVRYGNLSTKIKKTENIKYQNLSENINRMIETLNDREKMIVEYQNEQAKQNKFLESIINSLSEGILIVDENQRILRLTPQIFNWLEKDERELIGKNVCDYIQPQEDVDIKNLNQDEIFIKNKPESSFEAYTISLEMENKKRFIILIKDVTNQKELEKMKEDFVATLTHDLKVPIVAESNILDFLIEGKFGEINEKQYEAIKNMKACNQELIELVQILLETYKIKETGISLEKEFFDTTPFLNTIIDEITPIIEKSNLKINFYPQENIQINADKIQLKRVIKNLVQNAISHSDSKDIDIKVEKIENFIQINIIDYGKGIAKEDLEKIFNKYYSTAKKFRKIGTGLGLYLSQQIIKSHGGEITVQSEENSGTTFSIKLPA